MRDRPVVNEPVAGTGRSRLSGVLRMAFRLPVNLYRMDLGWLPGHRSRVQ
jgi:hypothetical protein